jgi:hypothetical protein
VLDILSTEPPLWGDVILTTQSLDTFQLVKRAVQLALVGGFVAKKVAWCQVCVLRTLGFP